MATEKFIKLKRANGSAPHKPILLLALISLFEDGLISENKIPISAELISAFQKIWLELVKEDKWQPRFFLPFFHLSNDGFWHLSLKNGAKVELTSSYSPKSLVALRNSVRYAFFDEDLFLEMQSQSSRDEVKGNILKNYFPEAKVDIQKIMKSSHQYREQLELDFLEDKAADIESKYAKLIKTEARSILFRSIVPRIYKYRCAISGHFLSASNAIQMIDACHVKPWSTFLDDSITNGIALTPTLHRAFDNHLISIDSDYKVMISRAFKEDFESAYAIKQFEGKKLLLPEERKYYPSQEALKWHRSKLLRV